MKAKFGEIWKVMLDPFFDIALIASIIALFLASYIVALLDLLYLIIIYLAIVVFSPRLTSFFLKPAMSEIMSKRRMGLKYISLPTEYEKNFAKGEGFSALLKMVIFFNFFALLLIVRYFGLQGANLYEIYTTLILASVIAALISILITPLAMAVYVLEGTRYREFDEKNFKVDYPAYLYRRLIRSIFGYSNLIVLVWLYVDLLTISKLNIISSTTSFIMLTIMVFGTISFGAILALIIVRVAKSEIVKQQIISFDEQIREKSMPAWEFIESIEEKFKAEKPDMLISEEKTDEMKQVETETEVDEEGESPIEEIEKEGEEYERTETEEEI